MTYSEQMRRFTPEIRSEIRNLARGAAKGMNWEYTPYTAANLLARYRRICAIAAYAFRGFGA